MSTLPFFSCRLEACTVNGHSLREPVLVVYDEGSITVSFVTRHGAAHADAHARDVTVTVAPWQRRTVQLHVFWPAHIAGGLRFTGRNGATAGNIRAVITMRLPDQYSFKRFKEVVVHFIESFGSRRPARGSLVGVADDDAAYAPRANHNGIGRGAALVPNATGVRWLLAAIGACVGFVAVLGWMVFDADVASPSPADAFTYSLLLAVAALALKAAWVGGHSVAVAAAALVTVGLVRLSVPFHADAELHVRAESAMLSAALVGGGIAVLLVRENAMPAVAAGEDAEASADDADEIGAE